MSTTRRVLAQAALGVAVLLQALAVPAEALRTVDGLRVSVTSTDPLKLPGGGLIGSSLGVVGGGLRYDIQGPNGQRDQGIVPGTEGSSGLELALAQNPSSGDVVLVFTDPTEPSGGILTTHLEGATWAGAQELFPAPGNPLGLALAFRSGGDAVLAWTQADDGGCLFVRHFELTRSGETALYSFAVVRAWPHLLAPVGRELGLNSGLAHMVAASDSNAAHVLLADSDLDAVGVLRLTLDFDLQGGGFGAPPVPVTLASVMPTSTTDGPLMGEGSKPSLAGTLIAPHRMDAFGFEVYYWPEDDALRAVLCGARGTTTYLELPPTDNELLVHFLVLQAVRQHAGRGGALTPTGPGGASGRRLGR